MGGHIHLPRWTGVMVGPYGMGPGDACIQALRKIVGGWDSSWEERSKGCE